MVRARLAHPSAATMDDTLMEQRSELRSWLFCAGMGELFCILVIFMAGFHLPSYASILLFLIAIPNTVLTMRHFWSIQHMEQRRFGCGGGSGERPEDSSSSSSNGATAQSGTPRWQAAASLTDDPAVRAAAGGTGCLGPLATIRLVWRVRWLIFLILIACIVELLLWFTRPDTRELNDRGGVICGVVVSFCYLVLNLGICIKFYFLVEVCLVDPRIMYAEAMVKGGAAAIAAQQAATNRYYDVTEGAGAGGGTSSSQASTTAAVVQQFVNSRGEVSSFPNRARQGPRGDTVRRAPHLGGHHQEAGPLEAVSLRMDAQHLALAVVGAPQGLDPQTGQVESHLVESHLLHQQQQQQTDHRSTSPELDGAASRGNDSTSSSIATSPFAASSSSTTRLLMLPSRFTNRSEPYGRNADIGRSTFKVPPILGYQSLPLATKGEEKEEDNTSSREKGTDQEGGSALISPNLPFGGTPQPFTSAARPASTVLIVRFGDSPSDDDDGSLSSASELDTNGRSAGGVVQSVIRDRTNRSQSRRVRDSDGVVGGPRSSTSASSDGGLRSQRKSCGALEQQNILVGSIKENKDEEALPHRVGNSTPADSPVVAPVSSAAASTVIWMPRDE